MTKDELNRECDRFRGIVLSHKGPITIEYFKSFANKIFDAGVKDARAEMKKEALESKPIMEKETPKKWWNVFKRKGLK